MNSSIHPLRFRQIHLDFHTSPHISGIGEKFEKKRWQETLQAAAIDSITLFSKCHHGWSYHPTKVGKIHPHLNFDLLRQQYDATKEVGINAPIYLSAEFDQLAPEEQPCWREIDKDGRPISRGAGPSMQVIIFWIFTAPTSITSPSRLAKLPGFSRIAMASSSTSFCRINRVAAGASIS